MHVEDFVVLGRTVPEDSRKFGQRICMAGYSPFINQFLRFYPLMVPVGVSAGQNGFRARFMYALDLRRNDQDSRSESWRVLDESRPTSTPWEQAVECPKAQVIEWLEKRLVPSIEVLNRCRLSLGVLKVPGGKWEGLCVARSAPPPVDYHQSLFDDLSSQAEVTPNSITANQIQFAPYLRFEDEIGSHQLQIREWGAYLLLAQQKYASDPEALWSAPAYRRGKDLYVVVGNMNNHRKNWLVIKTFEADEAKGPGLFDAVSSQDE
jgi:hypothetical protein